jgi:hypothetical protein
MNAHTQLHTACPMDRSCSLEGSVVAGDVAPPDVVVGGEVVRADGAPAAVRVELRRHPLVLQLPEHGREDAPRRVELVAPDEEPALALDGVQQQPLVRVRDLAAVPLGVEQVEVAAVQPHAQPGHLVVDLEVDRLVGLHPEHQLVGRRVQVRPDVPPVQVARHPPELHPDLRPASPFQIIGCKDMDCSNPERAELTAGCAAPCRLS